MTTTLRTLLLSTLALCAAGSGLAQSVKVDAGMPDYRKAGAVQGNLNSIGSDTMNNLMTLWAEGFAKRQGGVKVQVEGKGSATAPPALIAGTSQLGPMSRAMKAAEEDEFEKKFGYKPTRFAVAIDGLAVFVNKDNPLESLTFEQIDAVFSKTRACGGSKDVATWGDLGLTGEWAAKPISLYGRNSASGTYGYFKEHALCKGDYRDTVKEQPGSSAVVDGIGNDKYAMGYSGVGYRTSNVKSLALAKKAGETAVSDSPDNVLSGKYPLSRYLYVYVNKAPGKPLDPLVKEFLSYVLSKEGQEVVVKDGFLPLTVAKVAGERKNLD